MSAARTERRPRLAAKYWVQVPCIHTAGAVAESAWQRGPLRVISSLVYAELPQGDGIDLQWHVSVSCRGRIRPRERDVRRVLRTFDMLEAESDNHHPGNTSQFWLPVDPAHRVSCECKETEQVIVEPDGHTWTNPREGEGECRGCSISSLTGRPCSLHGQMQAGAR